MNKGYNKINKEKQKLKQRWRSKDHYESIPKNFFSTTTRRNRTAVLSENILELQ